MRLADRIRALEALLQAGAADDGAAAAFFAAVEEPRCDFRPSSAAC